MGIEKWEQRDRQTVADMRIFRLSRLVARSPRTGRDRDVALIETSDWVNVIAVTSSKEVVLVEQYRHGTDEVTLEIPGGLIDAGETAEQAAVRELREETGFTGMSTHFLGTVEPNPAFLNNRCHTFLVEGCRRTHELALDEGEDIEVRLRPLSDVPTVIAEGGIRHALVVCGFWWLALRRPDLFAVA